MNKKAVILLSGGLDSTLAAKLMLEQGVELLGVNFDVGFESLLKPGKQSQVAKSAEELGIKFTKKDVSIEFFNVLKGPKFGYGSGKNPCIDCKIFMLKKAKELMREVGASFIVTGEVLGERPMSQRRDTLAIIERESGLKGLLLRPLSARLLDPTEPEKKGIINREKLLAIQGRSRKPQFELAEKFGIRKYPNPAGGCLLTDPAFSKKVDDLLTHNALTFETTQLLKFGRHFRLSAACKLVVGRNERENNVILELAKAGDILMNAGDIPAPIGLLREEISGEVLNTALRVVARYADGNNRKVRMEYWKAGNNEKLVAEITPLKENELETIRI
jgi:tRNA U34 2-thiouridine synthase MnmA/TrmU